MTRLRSHKALLRRLLFETDFGLCVCLFAIFCQTVFQIRRLKLKSRPQLNLPP